MFGEYNCLVVLIIVAVILLVIGLRGMRRKNLAKQKKDEFGG